MENAKKNANSLPGAYLVLRDGSKWSDVFRLVPGRSITIGRAPTNQIVIREEQASRQHAEVFLSDGKWVVRDLNSRNGTAIGKNRLIGDRVLKPGDVIWIAKTQLVFVDKLSTAYDKKILSQSSVAPETLVGLALEDDQPTVQAPSEPETITHSLQKTKFLDVEQDDEWESIPKIGRAAARLCRLGFDLANETTVRGIARIALDALIDEVGVDAAGVLMVPRSRPTATDPELLEIVAWHSSLQPEYQRVSKFLAETVLKRGEAVLARDILDDSALGLRDSKGEIAATSVICAPIRVNNRNVGLVHLYSTKSDLILKESDLEFTLAVAETMALALKMRYREQRLVDDLSKTKSEVDQLREQLGVQSEIIGSSSAMLSVHQQIARAAPSNATVLIRGESGVGKELVARAIHFNSPRREGKFICLNCAALSESLLESELFGHEKGAFTGATDRKIGKFEAADRGTLMLDEIGEMSLSIQAKFLRVLEGHPFERVGGSKSIKVDVRVIAATNRDLERAVREGIFRKDLYFRLNVVQIEIPPLRRRVEDIPELAQFFLGLFGRTSGRRNMELTANAIEMLKRYRWPGNIRELRNVIERAVLLTRDPVIDIDDILLTNLTTASESQIESPVMPLNSFRPLTLEELEARHIRATLQHTDWNKSRAAQILGVERSTLDRKIKRYNISD